MRKLRLASAVLLLISPLAAHSVPVVATADCVDVELQCATGVTGLEVLGAVLDVTFVAGSSYDNVFASADPFFLGDEEGALAAMDAIVAAFADAIYGAVGMGSDPSFTGSSLIFIPYFASETSNSGAYAGGLSGETSWFVTTYGARSAEDFSAFEPRRYTSYAVFSPTRVPEPGTLALLGIGLFGIGWARLAKQA